MHVWVDHHQHQVVEFLASKDFAHGRLKFVHDRLQLRKRGGGFTVFSLDQSRDENWLEGEPVDAFTPEQAYDRHWAEAVVARANARLRQSYVADGQVERFEALKGYLAAGHEPASYAEVAAQLGLTVAAVKYHIRQGNLIGMTVLGRLAFDRAELDRFKASKRSQGRPKQG